jgi:hypothetical protein
VLFVVLPTLNKVVSGSVKVSLRIALPTFSKVIARASVAVSPKEGREEEACDEKRFSQNDQILRGGKRFTELPPVLRPTRAVILAASFPGSGLGGVLIFKGMDARHPNGI